MKKHAPPLGIPRGKSLLNITSFFKVTTIFTKFTSCCWFALFIGLLIIVFSEKSFGATFPVSTVEELVTALADAESNNQDDIIEIEAGTYVLSEGLSYDPGNGNEDFSITLRSVNGEAVIDGYGNRVLFMRTYDNNGHITLQGLTLKNGYVPEGSNGAGLFVNISNGDLLIENVKIEDNFAAAFYFSNDGGGAYITSGFGASITIRNSVVSGNVAKGYGGGLYIGLIDGTLNFINNTIVNNNNKTSAVIQGGGIFFRLYFASATAHIYNNIFWENTFAHGNGDFYIDDDGDNNGLGASVTIKNNNYDVMGIKAGDNLVTSDNLNTDPQLTDTYKLSSGSACLEAGNNSAPQLPLEDIEGDPRSVDSDCNGAILPDIGADELYRPPQITTATVYPLTPTTARGGGNVISGNDHVVSARGVCLSTEALPDLLDQCTVDGSGLGSYTSQLTELSLHTKYYARAYATNCEGTSYGEQMDFETSELPTVLTLPISDIKARQAQGEGNVIGPGASNVLSKGICWSSTQNPETDDDCLIEGEGTGSFSGSMKGLTPDTRYYVRAFASNSHGTAYGNEVSFVAVQSFPWPFFLQAINGSRRNKSPGK